ncbi:MAG: glycoside hydrolase family 127 protein [Phycisphaerales bacterium]|nr:MAG: glycoside hydrolase family 127 protein [Phycisphaerales bacterium]
MAKNTLFVALIVLLGSQAVACGVESIPDREVIEFGARPFDLKRVRLLDGPFKDAMERDRRYLHELDSDRLLHMFRVNADLPSSAEPLGGWERPDCEVRGHTMGHYLSACALMYASTGDQALKNKADRIVDELAKCQKALGDSGYLSAFPETWFDRVESFKPVWAPYYTLHKIYAGLVDMYVHCGNQQALKTAEKMAAWNKSRLDRLDGEHMQQMLDRTEQGGMNDVLANLYSVTGDRTYLELSERFNQKRYVDPLGLGEDRLKGEHVNSFIPNIIGTARQYVLTGDTRDRKIAEYFWRQVVNHRSYCTGGTSNNEHWHSDPDQLANELGDHTQETCCTYNMLKLTRHLFTWRPDVHYADYYERALYNSILSTQNPRTGMMMYFVVLASGRWKMFNLPTESFWCCTGTGLENHAKYGDSIYFHRGDTLYVNLFIASELDFSARGVRLRQDTNFPDQDVTTLGFKTSKPTRIDLHIRVPYWAKQGVTAKLNGKRLDTTASPSSYLIVDRTWTNGDRLEVRLPMSLHTHRMPDDETLMAFMYGPLVLAGKLGGEGLTEENTHTSQNWYRFTEGVAPVAPLVVQSDDVEDWIKPVAGKPLTFRTAGDSEASTLVPYHELFDQRYVVYWRVLRKESEAHRDYLAKERQREELEARTVDRIEIGNETSEKKHGLDGRNTESGLHQGRTWRHARDGGWFSYRLAVLPDQPMTLQCTYWGSDVGRTFDVLVDGQRILTETLDNDVPGEFFEQQRNIPRELTVGKREITVKFQAHPGSMAGGVFGCLMLK